MIFSKPKIKDLVAALTVVFSSAPWIIFFTIIQNGNQHISSSDMEGWIGLACLLGAASLLLIPVIITATNTSIREINLTGRVLYSAGAVITCAFQNLHMVSTSWAFYDQGLVNTKQPVWLLLILPPIVLYALNFLLLTSPSKRRMVSILLSIAYFPFGYYIFRPLSAIVIKHGSFHG